MRPEFPAARGPFYITTAIAYPNGAPHIGHAYEYIATDAIARFKRLDGFDVRYLTGTDVHGQKMAEAAAAEGITAAELATRNLDVFQALQEKLNISFDRFIRTSDADHYEASKEIWRRMFEAGTSTSAPMPAGTPCATNASSRRGRDRRQGPRRFGRPVRHRNRHSRHVDRGTDPPLSAYTDRLLAHYEAHPEFIGPGRAPQRDHQLRLGWAQGSRRSRGRRSTGAFRSPATPSTSCTWVDALTNYLTGVGFPTPPPRTSASTGLRTCTWTRDIRFHSVYRHGVDVGRNRPSGTGFRARLHQRQGREDEQVGG